MKVLIVILALLSSLENDPLKTGKINKAKREAKQLYISGDYKGAISKYKYLTDSLGVKETELDLNLANAYYLTKDTVNAMSLYQNLTAGNDPVVRSKANQQLGIMTYKSGKHEEALSYFKQAVKAHPENEDARQNYEMLKKKLEDKKKKEEQQKKDDKKSDNQEPSEFAKRLKEQADRLVARQQYREAYDLMNEGLKKDQTVSTYQDYIKRLGEVSEINK